MEVCPATSIILHHEDASGLGLNDGDTARVVSPGGSVEGKISARFRGPKGIVQVSHHFPAQPLNRLLGWGDEIVRVRLEKA